MATWDSLAPEIHHIIFSFFCQDLITQYKDCAPEILFKCKLSNSSRPTAHAQSLIDFSSALCVSRSFHHSLLHVKFEGETAIKALQSAQRDRCETILELLKTDSWSRMFMNLGVFVLSVGGVFWKNPLVMRDTEFMWKVLFALTLKSLFMLIPHLEDWILENASPVPDEESCSYVSRDFLYYPAGNTAGDIVFESRYWNGPSGSAQDGTGDVVAIKGFYEGGLYLEGVDRCCYEEAIPSRHSKRNMTRTEYALCQKQDNEERILKCSVLEELEKTNADWWLFTLTDDDFQDWVMVDYRGRRMWGTMCNDKMCYWHDVWKLKTWRVGEDESFTKHWFWGRLEQLRHGSYCECDEV